MSYVMRHFHDKALNLWSKLISDGRQIQVYSLLQQCSSGTWAALVGPLSECMDPLTHMEVVSQSHKLSVTCFDVTYLRSPFSSVGSYDWHHETQQ